MLNTQSATVGQLVDQRQMTDLPLNGRRRRSRWSSWRRASWSILVDQARVESTWRFVLPHRGSGVGVNGTGASKVNFQMDGAGHNDTYVNMNLPFPNPDAIQEFNLQSSNMSAEYGGSAALVNIVTKSGTNSFHGNAFRSSVRNGTDMNARNSLVAPSPDTAEAQPVPGGTVGGPIKKVQGLFFFKVRTRALPTAHIRATAAALIGFVPTAAERTGNFSTTAKQLVNPNGNTPFPGNQIPLSLFTVAVELLPGEDSLLPNGPGVMQIDRTTVRRRGRMTTR